MNDSKTCTRCGEVKPLDQYGVQKNVKDGRKSRCRACLSALSREYNASNPDKRRASERSWRERNPQRVKETARKSRDKHADGYRERLRKWKDGNRSRVNASHQRRRALKLQLRNDLTEKQRFILDTVFGGCALTGVKEDVHLDHFIALDTGHGGTWAGNIIPLSGHLNLSKGAKNPFEWVKERGDIDLVRFWFVVDVLAAVNGLTREEYVLYVYCCYENPGDGREVRQAC